MTRDIQVTVVQYAFSYSHQFKGYPNSGQVPVDSIYVTTPSDYKRICETVKKNGIDDKEICRLLSVKEVVDHEQMPKQVSFRSSLEEAYEPFEEKDKVTVAVMNAVSNALGDYLTGMNAFNVFQEKLKEKYPDKEFVFNLFQLNPYRLAPITKQWKHLYANVGTMPVNLSLFYSHDAFMDFGGLLLVDTFDTQPMFDFFLEGFSAKKEHIPPEKKRLKYETTPVTNYINDILMKHVRKRAKGRKVVLIHPMSTTPIRTMPNLYAAKLIKELNKKGYFTISAVQVPIDSKDHMNLHNFSTELDDFAAIIKSVDGIITVDTVTTHLADCFDTPTVALFTSIDPKYRIPYYPNVRGIMLEKPGGMLYGKHKLDLNTEEGKKADKHALRIWDRKRPKEIVAVLKEMIDKA